MDLDMKPLGSRGGANNSNSNNATNTTTNPNNGNQINIEAMSSSRSVPQTTPQDTDSPSSSCPKSIYDIDVIRLIGQHLAGLGYNQTVDLLLKESGLQGLDHPLAVKFQQNILSGDWDRAEALVNELASLFVNSKQQQYHQQQQQLQSADKLQQNNAKASAVPGSAAITTAPQSPPPPSASAAAATSTPASSLELDKSQIAKAMRSAIAEQKFFEYLEDNDRLKALKCLRLEIVPFSEDIKHVQHLATLLMCKTLRELRLKANWPGKGQQSRQSVVDKLRPYIPATVLLPPKRLSTLLSQAIELQRNRCVLHISSNDEDHRNSNPNLSTSGLINNGNMTLNGDDYANNLNNSTANNMNNNFNSQQQVNGHSSNAANLGEPNSTGTAAPCSSSSSLMSLTAIHETRNHYVDLKQDHICSGENFPLQLRQELDSHKSQVWFCKFSNDGTKLATGGLGGKVKIWTLEANERKLVEKCTLDCNSNSITCLSWSPNGVYLLVCGSEDRPDLWIWNVNKEEVHNTISHTDDESATTCSWHMSGEKFAAASIKGNFHVYDLDGNRPGTREGVRVQCLSFLHNDPNYILAADTLNRIKSYAIKDMSLETDEEDILEERHSIISFIIDKDDKYIAVNVLDQGIHLWDFRLKTLLRMFPGVIQRNTTIHSSFSSPQPLFIASGSEDGKVYIYHLNRDQPVVMLLGHSRCVNCVSWNPKYPELLVSVSDDRTVRLWGPIDRASKWMNQLSVKQGC